MFEQIEMPLGPAYAEHELRHAPIRRDTTQTFVRLAELNAPAFVAAARTPQAGGLRRLLRSLIPARGRAA